MRGVKPENFERELREVLDDKFIKRVINLKRTGNIFSPLFYLLFTRLVELSSVLNDVVLPNQIELMEMFRTRKEFLQLDYNTINEGVRRVWFFESKRDEEYGFTKSLEDFFYIIYRMRDIQKRIDSVILKNIEHWNKDEIARIYFIMLKVFLEIEEEINKKVEKLGSISFVRRLFLGMFSGEKRKEAEELILDKSEEELIEIFRALMEGDTGEEVSRLSQLLNSLTVSERLAIVKSVEVIIYNK